MPDFSLPEVAQLGAVPARLVKKGQFRQAPARWSVALLTGRSIRLYIQDLTSYVADQVRDQIPDISYRATVETNTVTSWLLYEEPGWDEVCS